MGVDKTLLNDIFRIVIGPVSGAALALIVNRLFEIKNKKPKLVFGIRYTHDVYPDSDGTKIDPSGFELYCVNIGQIPIFIEKILFYSKNYKKNFYSQVFPERKKELSAVMPFTPAVFSINNQEYDNICHFCKEKNKYKCKVVAYGIDNKKSKGEVDLWWIKDQDWLLPDVVL